MCFRFLVRNVFRRKVDLLSYNTLPHFPCATEFFHKPYIDFSVLIFMKEIYTHPGLKHYQKRTASGLIWVWVRGKWNRVPPNSFTFPGSNPKEKRVATGWRLNDLERDRATCRSLLTSMGPKSGKGLLRCLHWIHCWSHNILEPEETIAQTSQDISPAAP